VAIRSLPVRTIGFVTQEKTRDPMRVSRVLVTVAATALLAPGCTNLADPTATDASWVTRVHLDVNPLGLTGLTLMVGPTQALTLLPPSVVPAFAETVATHTFLGRPTSHAGALADGGTYQRFEGGAIYSWGSDVFVLPTEIAAYYAQVNGPAGELGRPTGPVQHRGSAAALPLQHGTIYTSPAGTFATVAPIWSPDQDLWGSLGAATSSAKTTESGVHQSFTNGLRWSPASGPGATVDVAGDAAVVYLAQGGVDGKLGLPTGPLAVTETGESVQPFTAGAIYQTDLGMVAVADAIYDTYLAWAGPTGDLGLPVTPAAEFPGGTGQQFTSGAIYSSEAGTFVVLEPLLSHYLADGGPTGPLGLPTSAAYDAGGGVTAQDFTGGVVQDPPPWRPPEGILGPVESMPVLSGGVPISAGWNGTRVHALQERLGIHRVETAQTYDAETEAAVRSWQADHGLPVTGVVDEATWNSINPGPPFTIDAWRPEVTVPMTATAAQRTDALVEFAVSQVGAQYAWGGAGPFEWGYDCSGIVLAALNAAGLDPGITPLMHAEPDYRSTYTLFHYPGFAHVPVSQMQRGDLVFFQDTSGVLRHTAVYIGDGMMVESTVRNVKYKAYSPNLYGYQVMPTVIRPFPEG
jgi:cell wall-associated NlpC family hydrolase